MLSLWVRNRGLGLRVAPGPLEAMDGMRVIARPLHHHRRKPGVWLRVCFRVSGIWFRVSGRGRKVSGFELKDLLWFQVRD